MILDATNPWHCPISMLSHIVTYINWPGPLCNGLFPLDHEVLRHLWIFSRLKSNESVTIPFTYIQIICTSKCFFVYLMYIFVRAYLQSITGCAYALYSTKYFLYIYGAIGTWMMFFLGRWRYSLNTEYVCFAFASNNSNVPVSCIAIWTCLLCIGLNHSHVYIRPRCPLNCIPPPYLSYNYCLFLHVHRLLKITTQPPQPSKDFHIYSNQDIPAGSGPRMCLERKLTKTDHAIKTRPLAESFLSVHFVSEMSFHSDTSKRANSWKFTHKKRAKSWKIYTWVLY